MKKLIKMTHISKWFEAKTGKMLQCRKCKKQWGSYHTLTCPLLIDHRESIKQMAEKGIIRLDWNKEASIREGEALSHAWGIIEANTEARSNQ